MTKTIENKVTSLPASETTQLTYADLALIAFNKPIKEGIDLVTMRKNLRIIGVLDSAKSSSVFELEDEDFKTLAEAVETSVWAVAHVDILDFSDYVLSLKGESVKKD